MATDARTDEIIGMEWADFAEWFATEWQPGEHLVAIGTTGQGKTTFIARVLTTRRHVLALDIKGGDSTLAKLGAFGFERRNWPLKDEDYQAMGEGGPGRFIIGQRVARMDDLWAEIPMFKRCIQDVFAEGFWTVYVDEGQMASDPKMMGLGKDMELNYIAARDRKVSMVMSKQQMSWTPKASHRQASWTVLWRSRDKDFLTDLARAIGRPPAVLRGAVSGMEKYSALVIPPEPFDPIRLVRAPVL